MKLTNLIVGKLRVSLLQLLVSVSSVQDVCVGGARNSLALDRRGIGRKQGFGDVISIKLDPDCLVMVLAAILDQDSGRSKEEARGPEIVTITFDAVTTIHDIFLDVSPGNIFMSWARMMIFGERELT